MISIVALALLMVPQDAIRIEEDPAPHLAIVTETAFCNGMSANIHYRNSIQSGEEGLIRSSQGHLTVGTGTQAVDVPQFEDVVSNALEFVDEVSVLCKQDARTGEPTGLSVLVRGTAVGGAEFFFYDIRIDEHLQINVTATPLE